VKYPKKNVRHFAAKICYRVSRANITTTGKDLVGMGG